MVFKRESVYARLKKLEEVLAILRAQGPFSVGEFKKDTRLQWIIERGLELAASLILDIGNHILAGIFQTSVDEYEKILEKLNEKRVLSDELYRELRGLGGFRNILVHGYLDLDLDLVYAHYQRGLRVFPQFIAEIETWLREYEKRSAPETFAGS